MPVSFETPTKQSRQQPLDLRHDRTTAYKQDEERADEKMDVLAPSKKRQWTEEED